MKESVQLIYEKILSGELKKATAVVQKHRALSKEQLPKFLDYSEALARISFKEHTENGSFGDG